MVKAIRNSSWLALFETDYRWSFNTLMLLSFARHGGSEIGEVYRVVQRLNSHIGDDERWFEEWVVEADRVRAMGDEAERRGKHLSAGAHFRRAAAYYFVADRFRMPKDDEANRVYTDAVRLFRRAAVLRKGLPSF